MSREVISLFLAVLFFAAAFIHAALHLRRGTWQAALPGFLLMVAAFACQCAFLHWRGRTLGKCPITTPSELLIFVGWSMVIFYFISGTSYRHSLMGAFTAPIALSFTLAGLSSYQPATNRSLEHNFWNELHAALALMSYGAMALAFVAAIMFLLMDRLLKQHTQMSLVWKLPPVQHLSQSIRRLLIAATALLGAGIFCGYKMTTPPAPAKLLIIWAILTTYLCILLYEYWRGMSARRAAWAALIAFFLPVISLWFVARR